jgi:uncharacterized membrane protein YGL010W
LPVHGVEVIAYVLIIAAIVAELSNSRAAAVLNVGYPLLIVGYIVAVLIMSSLRWHGYDHPEGAATAFGLVGVPLILVAAVDVFLYRDTRRATQGSR